ncbi:MAG TPA: ATP-binding protein [Opitutaceae bacterium]|nr:ATP-binding protein [Opitutaceae bacterium]
MPQLLRPPFPLRTRLRRVLACGALAAAALLRAQPSSIRAAAPGLNEAGVPAFAISSPAALGLSAPPTDLQPLPDGRILALAGRELAIGDGTRWEVFRLAASDTLDGSTQVSIDAAGQLYVGMPSWFARLEFRPEGYLRRVPVTQAPNPMMLATTVQDVRGRWYWHGGTGDVVRWRPGEHPTTVARITDFERAFELGGSDYISDRANGTLWRVTPEGPEQIIAAEKTNVSYSVTCGLDLGEGRLFVGTNGHGLRRFEKGLLLPIESGGALAGLSRINDLCATVPGLYAAAIDNVGIVFFDRQLRTIQVLDRSLDHRLARVRRLFYSRLGVVWGLLNDGIVRVDFPARLSYYEPFVSTGLVFAQPYRFDGRLWLLGDGQAQRGIYNDEGRLLRFDIDTPADEFLCALSTETGALLAGGRRGLYRRGPHGWKLVADAITDPHLANTPDATGRWAVLGDDAYGWLRIVGEAYEMVRFPAPELRMTYGAIRDRHGALWGELGTGRVARLELTDGAPRFEIFGAEHGVGGSWVQLTVLEGEMHANVTGHLLRFEPALRRFVPANELTRAIPEVQGVAGRPAYDARGQFWLATANAPLVFARQGPVFCARDEEFPAGLQPLFFTPDDSGPVWLHQRLKLARYDPDVPVPPRAEASALITRVQLTNSNRSLFAPRRRLPELPADDNSLIVHYVAVGAPPSRTVTFQVRLAGASDEWVSTGVAGSTSFNRLDEGNYILQLRPVTDNKPGPVTSLEFTVRPHWSRTRTAYAAYGVAAFAFVGLIAWYASWRERVEKARLEMLVAQRTRELNEVNLQLASNIESTLQQAEALRVSEERYRQLSTELEHRVAERTEALVRTNEQLTASNQELESFSYSISHDLRAPLRNINGFVDLLRRRNRDSLDPESNRFFQIITAETIRLSQLIDSLLAFARLNRADFKVAPVALNPLATQVIAELRPEYDQRLIEWKIGPLPTVTGDATLLRQVLANFLSNAIKFTRHRSPGVIEIGTVPPDPLHPGEHAVFVRDNGAGFDPKYSSKLFGVFQRLHHVREFEGTGIGLANAKRIVLRHGGRVWAEGKPGEGATFYFALPIRPAQS